MKNYNFFCELPLVTDSDGGESVADAVAAHGREAVMTLFSEWLDWHCETVRREREVEARRKKMRLM